MKRSILRHKFALWLVVALALASCSQDELAGGEQGTLLPYGKYPLELTAAIGEAVATPATRGTVHGTFPQDYVGYYLKVASSIDYPDENKINWYYGVSGVGDYHIDEIGTMVWDFHGSRDNNIYWRHSDEKIYVYAYSNGNTPDERNTLPHEVYEDQREDVKFNESDYLFAYTALTFDGDKTLTFRHLTSKVTINLKQSDYLQSQDPDDVSVTLNSKGEQWYIQGNFIGTKPKEITLFEAEGLEQSEIIPYKNPNPTGDDIYATYEAVVIPQTIAGTGKTIEIKVGETTYSYEVECSKGQYTSGEEWIYNITVDAKGLNVKVEEGNIGWGKGDTGSGSVAL